MIKKEWHKKHSSKMVFTGELINRMEHLIYSTKSMVFWFFRGEWGYLKKRVLNKRDLV